MEYARDLSTPALILDRDILARNIGRMKGHLDKHGAVLRLHGKTCKNVNVAAMCVQNGSLAVSTLAEAEYYAASGFEDLIYAVGITPGKLSRALALRERGVGLALVLDSMEMARMLVEFALAHRHAFSVLLEIDCDGHRSGLNPDSPKLTEIAAFLASNGQTIAGVLTHAGSAYELANPGPSAFRELSRQENRSARKAAHKLLGAGFQCPVVSVGSTPTAMFGDDFQGITEVRAGVFPFNDCVMAALGVCATGDIALSVLCAVSGRRERDNAIIVDAGWSSLSADRGINAKFSFYGYGLVCDEAGNPLPGLRVAELNQEHGIIKGSAPVPIPVGSLLRILPAHACAAAQSFNGYNVVENGRLTTFWPRCQGW